MSDKFDPYHRWLAIPPQEQPPSHYRLLGLAKFEADVDVIDSAADRQMAHVRTHQAGKYAEASQKLLNEIAAARVVLLDAEKKAAYDATLREQETPLKKAAPLPQAQPLAAAPLPKSIATPLPLVTLAAHKAAAPPDKIDISSFAPLVLVGAIGAIVLLLAVGLGGWWLLGSSEEQVAQVVPQPPVPYVPTDPPVRPVDPPVVNPVPVDPPVVDPVQPDPPVEDPIVTPPVENPPVVDPSIDDPPVDDPPVSEPPPSPLADLFPPAAADTRTPLPDEAARTAKREQIEALFSVAGARSIAQRAEMAEKLIATARDSNADPAAQYVLLDMARETASTGGHVDLASEAVNELNKTFQVDGLVLRAESLAQASPAVTKLEARKELVDDGIKLVNQLFAADKFTEAAKLIKSLQSVAAKTRDKEQRATLAASSEQGSELYHGFKAAQAAIETLKKSPDDAAAALVAGKYYAFIKGDWQRGLVMLSVGTDAALKKLAEQEMQVPRTKEDRLALADAWLKQAENAKGLEADRQQARAAMWYRQVQSSLIGLAKVEVQRKLDALGKLAVDGGAPFNASSTPSVATRSSDELRKLRGLIHHWTFDERQGNTAKDIVGGNDFVFSGYASRQLPWSAGKLSGAAEFFGGANLAATKRPITQDHYTIAFWLKPGRSLGTNPRIIFPADGSYNWIMLNNENRRGVGFYFGQNKVQDTQPALVGEWEHYAVTVNLQGGHAVVYRQGKQVAYGAFRDNQPRGVWMLAHNSDPRNSGDSYTGQIDDLRIYARILADEEVEQLASAGDELPEGSDDAPSADPRRAVDLLALVDAKTAVNGVWRKEGGSLYSPKDWFTRVPIAYRPPEEYLLEIEATRLRGEGELCIGLVYQGKQCHAALDRNLNTVSDLMVDMSTAPEGVARREGLALPAGRRHVIACKVLRNELALTVNDKPWLAWRGNATWKGINDFWAVPDKQTLMLGAWGSEFQIHSAKLTPLARGPSPAVGKPVDLLALIDVEKHRISGIARREGSDLVLPNEGWARVEIPYHPPAAYQLEVEATRQKEEGTGGDLTVGLVFQGKQIPTLVDAGNGTYSSMRAANSTGVVSNYINVPYDDGPKLRTGRRTKITYQVSDKEIRVSVDGRPLLTYRGNADWSHSEAGWAVRDAQALMIGAFNEPFKIHSIKLTPLVADTASRPPTYREAIFTAGGKPSQLQPLAYEDGPFTVAATQGKSALNAGLHYVYFQIDDDFLHDLPKDATAVEVVATVFDGEAGWVNVQYDGHEEIWQSAVLQQMAGSGKWVDLTFTLPDSRLANRLNGSTDLRMITGANKLILHKLVVRQAAPAEEADDGDEADAGPIDLLALTDPTLDAPQGAWRKLNGTLVSTSAAEAGLRIPYVPAQEYDFDLDLSLGDTTVDIEVKLPYGGTMFSLKLDSRPDVKLGVVRKFRCAVRKTGITVYQFEKQVAHIDRDPIAKPMRDNVEPLAIVTRGTVAHVSALRLTELSDHGAPLRKASGAADAAKGVYLDDLAEVSSSAHAPIGKHGKTGLKGHLNPKGEPEPADVAISEKAYEHALFAAAASDNAASSIVYDIGGKHRRLMALAGINDKAHSFTFTGPLKFQVIGDDKVLWTSGEFTKHGQTEAIDVDISGVRRLELKVLCTTGNVACAWAVWAEPKLLP